MELGLKGKVALVTGGSEGIGAATAIAFAREGAQVALCARREEPLKQVEAVIRQAGGDCLALTADVRRADDIERFVNEARQRFGRIDILVNNAGMAAANPFESITDEAWIDDLDLKVFAAIRTCRLVIPFMRAQGGGAIVNITQITGKQPGAASYPSSVSRAAGIALTKGLSKELAKDNIRVNTVCIGLVKSGQISRSAMRQHPDVSLDEAYARMGKNVPLGRLAESEEAADLITFLCSDRARYITGDAINFDGGSSNVP
jgi:NAD(P)-dependent dehydrogenase (short-subunit alcohol dehydrogenase family)